VESRSVGDIVHWAVVGFGVNMTESGAEVPVDLKNRIAYVDELDKNLDPGELAARIASGMESWSGAMVGEGWEKAMAQWSGRALLGNPYTFRNGGREIDGVPIRLDISGGLVMKTRDGEVVVYSGEIEERV
jgi:biotin-(acetyl-CoA carboxylase) ligase